MKASRSLFIAYIFCLLGCGTEHFDKSLINDSKKLVSPNGTQTLYQYRVESGMAFGSGINAIKILKTDEEPDLSDPDILRFDQGYPFSIKWKNEKRLIVKCLLNGIGLSEHQPIKKEVIKWKDFSLEVEYYGMFSSGAEQSFSFNTCSIRSNKLIFESDGDSLVFNKVEVQLSLDGNHIHVSEYKMNYYNNKWGLAFSDYNLKANKGYDKNVFPDEQPFVLIHSRAEPSIQKF